MLGTITLTVGQPDGVSVAQKEEAPETMEATQDEVIPQVNGDKVEKDAPDVNDISPVEEKATEEKPDEASEVGFKKIFRFVGFKFTLKKDKSEEKEPVKLLTVKDKESEEVSGTEAPADAKEEAATAEEEVVSEEKVVETQASTTEAEDNKDGEKVDAADGKAEGPVGEATEEEVKEEGTEKDSETSPPPQETVQSPFRKLFTGGLFSNLRKKASIKKPKEEEEKGAAEEETTKTEEAADAVVEEEGKVEVEQEAKVDSPATPEEEAKPAPTEPEVTAEATAPTATTPDETKPEEEKVEATAEEAKPEGEVSSEAELLSSQEKTKVQGSPLKKLFTGAGLKKLSSKKQKNKKDTEAKRTESGEQAAEQPLSSSESTEGPKPDSGSSSPDESGEHVIAVEATQAESTQEVEGEVASDGEKKKEGIIAWSSFKKLVTPKKRVKRPSESEDEATGEKTAKSATLSSTESAGLTDKSDEEEAKEEKPTEEEPKTETTEKLMSSTEEPKKKMDTSVSWEALMCMGGAKKRTRRTSDSDDDETKIDEDAPASAEDEPEDKTEEAVVTTSQQAESDGEVASSPEPLTSSQERESAWDTLKRLVMPKNKPKAEEKTEEKTEESAEQVQSDSEAPKDESMFSLRKFFPGRRKKKSDKTSAEQVSSEDDSDTPAVVPLSEYEDQVVTQQEEPAEQVAVEVKVLTEDRSPSWIPASVDVDDKHDQLSDIPEEAENAATPKSVDTDMTEDETEERSMPSPGAPEISGRRLSIAEVKPVAPAPADETTPVCQSPKPEMGELVVEGVEAQVCEVPCQTSVTVEDVPVEVAVAKSEDEAPAEQAESNTNATLELHTSSEATAICTGLETKEIAEALETPVTDTVECVTVIRDALGTEVLLEDKPREVEEAMATAEPVFEAQVHQVESTELEPVVRSSEDDTTEIETATQGSEPEIEKAGEVSTAVECEVIHPNDLIENSLKTENAITPTTEAAVINEIVTVTETFVETKAVTMTMEQVDVAEETKLLKDVVQVMTQETSTICETTKTAITEETESIISEAVAEQSEMVISETVVVAASSAEECVEVVMEKVSVQVQEAEKEEIEVVNAPVVGEVAEMTEEQDDVIQEQSVAIAQAVIQDAMHKMSQPQSEPQTPASPIATPVQAVETTEEEIETERPVISDTPVAVTCEAPAPKILHHAMEVTETVPEEVTERLDPLVEEEKVEELKQSEEVKESDESVQAESQTGEQVEEAKEEESKEDAAVQDVEPADGVSDVCEEATAEETPAENVPEIQMPVQIVLQAAQMLEAPSVEEETAVEFDSNGPITNIKRASPASPTQALDSIPTLPEEPQMTASAETEPEKAPSTKCAEVMAQVMEAIEEAVKEIEPVSTEITTAS
ncbi:A-kinase anchor protein 12b isoform X2 [Genypterus blacodes]|uniref:A-kinase anchor protein 12b isoform X2 n=1 Tax=Genypterus blacodes TaxID=154954 RepID=UPI003F7650D8